MTIQLKPIDQQVIVITGASSGIGLTTARMAAQQGARLVLAARSHDALHQLADEITNSGGQAVAVVADVSKQDDVRAIAHTAHDTFGSFDTWINNAGVGIFGKVEETSIDDMRQLFETNFWGVVYGSLEAVKHLKQRGGALINVGSVVSEQVVLLQGVYSTSKHAVKGFTDALRMELEYDDAPVSVTLIKPSAINTPFPLNAKNYLDKAPTLPPPVYAPDIVAQGILHSAQMPTRELIIGGGGKGMAALSYYAPRLMDAVMANRMFADMQKKDQPPRPREQNGLEHPSERLAQRGDYDGHTIESSVYTQAAMRPGRTGIVLLGAGLAALALWRAVQRSE